MIKKQRADQLVFDQGIAESREKAKSLIMAARIRKADGELIKKPGHLYSIDTKFELAEGKTFVSRGAYKLLTIFKAFSIDVKNAVCLDAGASTGGFTDCLLQNGAMRVYAVDVGHNQLHEKLRADSRVISLEGINLRYAEKSLIPEKIDFLVCDVSFISLTQILPACAMWLKPNARIALLIKPQFELSREEVPKGVVKSEQGRQKAVQKILSFCEKEMGWQCSGILPAQIKGPKGNQEYMSLFHAKSLNQNDGLP